MALRLAKIWNFIFLALLAACAAPAANTAAPTAALTASITPPLPTPIETKTAAPAALQTITPTDSVPTTEPANAVCSPLGGIPLADLAGLVSNPYHPPRPGFDDPHAGVDLAVTLPGSRVAISGAAVTAALAGRVIMVAEERFPFGNAIIVETPLDAAAPLLPAGVTIPTPAPTLPPLSALTCPPYPAVSAEGDGRSIYILYGHLRDAPAWSQGDPVTCGQDIGAVGDSGNALNPHLHFETRVGPAGVYLNPMAHYDAAATGEEMASYCLWSVSGMFQLVDPMQVLSAAAAGLE